MRRYCRAVLVCSLVAVGVGVWAAPVSASTAPAGVGRDRVAGADRYETAVEVARQVGGGTLSGLDRLIVVSGETFPDALAASGLAGYLDAGGRSGRTAIVLTRTASVPPVVEQAIRDSRVPASQIFVVGGSNAVSETVRDRLARTAGWNGTGTNPIRRLAGENRYETAAAIVDYVVQTAGGSLPDTYRTVLIASGEQFPDALSAGTLAYRNGHLLVLSQPSTLPDATKQAVQRLRASRAVLIGGPAALTPQIDTQLAALTTTQRIGGADRYQTAALVANEFTATNGPPTSVIIASGVDFPDALTIAPLTASTPPPTTTQRSTFIASQPLLLTAPTQLPPATSAWLSANAATLNAIRVIGGTQAVPTSVADTANNIINPPGTSDPTPLTPLLPPFPGPGPGPDPGPEPDPDPAPVPSNFTNATTAAGLGSDSVRGVFVSGSAVYAPTGGGLGISTDGGTTFTNATTAAGLGSDSVWGVFVSGSAVYAATPGGLGISTNGGANFTNRTIGNGLGNNNVSGVFVSGSTVYAATDGGLSISTDGGTTFVNATTAAGLGSSNVRGVFVSGSTVYAATGNGLSISTDGGTTFTNRTTANGLGDNFVSGVFVSGSTVYAATDGGLSISTDGGTTFTNRTTANGLGDNLVSGVFVSGSTVYAATNGGLGISTNGGANFTNRTTANGLGSNLVRGVFVSGSTVYAATSNGLSIST